MSQEPSQQVMTRPAADIAEVAEELDELHRRQVPPTEFYPRFLSAAVTALQGDAGAIWRLDTDCELSQLYQFRFGELFAEEELPRHLGLLNFAASAHDNIAIPSGYGLGQEGTNAASNPTDYSLYIACLYNGSRRVALVEVLQTAAGRSGSLSQYQQTLKQLCRFGTAYTTDLFQGGGVGNRFDILAGDTLEFRLGVEEFASEVHRNLDSKTVAYHVANEGRRLIECERLSLVLKHGRRAFVEAVSGLDVVNPRSNQIRTLAELTATILVTRESFHYTGGSPDDYPLPVREALNNYLDESEARDLYIRPLFGPKRESEDDDHNSRSETPEPFGALVAEFMDDRSKAPLTPARCETIIGHVETAMHNSLLLEQMPMWRFQKKLAGPVKGKRRTKLKRFLKILTVLAIIGAVLWFVETDFRIVGQGALFPGTRSRIYAPESATMRTVAVRHGSRVRKGELLASMSSSELDLSLRRAQTQLLDTTTNLRIREAERVAGNFSEVNQIALDGEIDRLKISQASLRDTVELLSQRLDSLQLTAPHDGYVTTWDVERMLSGRPVSRGEELMGIAALDDDTDWELQVMIPEKHIGYILETRDRLRDGEQLQVDYVLATHPETSWKAHVESIALRTTMTAAADHVVYIAVVIRPEKELRLRPGAEVRAKVTCGRRRLGFVLFHDLIEFVHRRILF